MKTAEQSAHSYRERRDHPDEHRSADTAGSLVVQGCSVREARGLPEGSGAETLLARHQDSALGGRISTHSWL